MPFYSCQLHIQGGAVLEMDGTGAVLTAHTVGGDNSGKLIVHKSQTFNATQSRALMQFGVLSHRDSDLQLPSTIDCRGIDFVIKGRSSSEVENIFMLPDRMIGGILFLYVCCQLKPSL